MSCGVFGKQPQTMVTMPMALDRRSVLMMLVSMGTLLLPASENSASELPGGTLRTFVRMRGMGHRPVAVGCLSGIYSGVVDGAVTPMFGVVSATFASYREVGGAYEIRSAEVAYFVDLDTDRVLEEWTNPFTNEILVVPVSNLPATTARVGTDLRFESQAPAIPGVQWSQSVSQPRIVSGEVWFTETIVVLRAASSAEPTFHYSDSTVLRARVTDLGKHRASSVRCSTSYQSVVSWRPWLKMGPHPGCMVGFGNGLYGVSIDELPPAWIKATEKHRPEILTDPATIIDSHSPRSH